MAPTVHENRTMQRRNLPGNPHRRWHHRLGALLLAAVALTCGLLAFASKVPFALPLLWPEEQRAFLQDGPGLLLTAAQIDELINLDAVARGEFIARYLANDPFPETPDNELAEGIRRRQALVRREFVSLLDDRAKLLFLHGEPSARETVDCDATFRPIEIRTYPPPPGAASTEPRHLVFYQPKPREPYKLWLPIDSKRVLYHPEMEYWLEQWEELRGRIFGGPRFDRALCEEAERVDEVTGVGSVVAGGSVVVGEAVEVSGINGPRPSSSLQAAVNSSRATSSIERRTGVVLSGGDGASER